jgi:hypothetical protein
MNVEVIHKANVTDAVLDALAAKLPSIISGLLEVPGGKMAILKPEQVSIQFSLASARDIGSDIRVIVLARSISPRTMAENQLATAILDQVVAVVGAAGASCSVSTRLYLTEIGAGEYTPVQ